jgi:hypothetical protein
VAAAEEVAPAGPPGLRRPPARARRGRGGTAGRRPRSEDRRREQRDAARAEVASDAERLARVDVRRPALELGLRGRDPGRSRAPPPARGDAGRAYRGPRRVGGLLWPQLLLPLLRATGPGHAGRWSP